MLSSGHFSVAWYHQSLHVDKTNEKTNYDVVSENSDCNSPQVIVPWHCAIISRHLGDSIGDAVAQ